MGFGERPFKQKVGRSSLLAFALWASWPFVFLLASHPWLECSGLMPCMFGRQLQEAGSLAGMCSSLRSSPWNATIHCSMAYGSWAASTLSHPEISTQSPELGNSSRRELPLHDCLECSGSTPQTLRESKLLCGDGHHGSRDREKAWSCRDGDPFE